jgi:gliding motility-associated lipoprotein GldD
VKNRLISILLIVLLVVAAAACRKTHAPKPRGYFRIDLPAKKYTSFNENFSHKLDLPVYFEYPVYGLLTFQQETGTNPGWFNLEFPRYNAKLYLTYKNVNNDIDSLLDQSYSINVKYHVSKADAINEQVINIKENKVFGILYDLKGNTASAVEFYVTDSVSHYLRGSLYFNAEPNADSLAPVIEFFRSDIVHLIETLKWK